MPNIIDSCFYEHSSVGNRTRLTPIAVRNRNQSATSTHLRLVFRPHAAFWHPASATDRVDWWSRCRHCRLKLSGYESAILAMLKYMLAMVKYMLAMLKMSAVWQYCKRCLCRRCNSRKYFEIWKLLSFPIVQAYYCITTAHEDFIKQSFSL